MNKVKIIMEDKNILMDLNDDDYIALLENIKTCAFLKINTGDKVLLINGKYILRIEVEKNEPARYA